MFLGKFNFDWSFGTYMFLGKFNFDWSFGTNMGVL